MGLNKKKRKWVWCTEKPIDTDLWTYKCDSVRQGNKILSKTTLNKRVALRDNKVVVDNLLCPIVHKSVHMRIPPRIKCPQCGRRFKPRVRECGDPGCWHVMVPPHKHLVIA